MKVLITGATGQLGRALQATLVKHDLVPLEHDRLDIARLADVRRAIESHRPGLVINAAAYNAVDQAESEPDLAFRVNALGPQNLAIATAAHGLALVHVSTDYVFDGTASSPYHEFDRTNPRSAYGRSKLAGEEAVRSVNPRHYIVRTAWLYHPVGRNFPLTMIEQRGRGSVNVVNDQVGSPTYVPHLAEAIGELIETEAFGTTHLAGHGETSWYELTRALYAELGFSTEVRPVSNSEFPRPAERPRYSALRTLRDPAILLPPWREGLAEFCRALK